MGQVTIQLNGRTYRLRCDDGQEERINGLAEYIGKRIDGIKTDVGNIGSDRLLLMAALMITDELWDARDELKTVQKRPSRAKPAKTAQNSKTLTAQDTSEQGDLEKNAVVTSETGG